MQVGLATPRRPSPSSDPTRVRAGRSRPSWTGRAPRVSPIEWEGALAPEQTEEQMHEASIYVLPSVDEPERHVRPRGDGSRSPGGHHRHLRIGDRSSRAGGIVVDATLDALVEAVRTLLGDPALADEMG